MRKVCYISGTRADFGLMQNVLHAINVEPQLNLSVVATGMHLLPAYGETWKEVAASGCSIGAKVPVRLTGASGAEMAIALGEQIIGFTGALQKEQPDLVLLLGDRGEMMAGAIASLHLNIPVAHIHGGELSGTVDESIRHAISKLAHYHFVATEKSRERLIRMGEIADNIFVTGAPGLDSIYQAELVDRKPLFFSYDLCPDEPLWLLVFHPVVQQAGEAAQQMQILLESVADRGAQILVVMPNADAGGSAISEVISSYAEHPNIYNAVHVPRQAFLSLIAQAEVMIGNSSSGIIEAASLGTPVINIGNRQQRRERNSNVIDVAFDRIEIGAALIRAQKMKGLQWDNIYGSGDTANQIVALLKSISLSSSLLEKVNAY